MKMKRCDGGSRGRNKRVWKEGLERTTLVMFRMGVKLESRWAADHVISQAEKNEVWNGGCVGAVTCRREQPWSPQHTSGASV
jgi:hypothetical protein